MAVTVKKGYIKMTAAGDSYATDIVPLFFRWYGADAGDTVTLNGDTVEIFRAVADTYNRGDMVWYGQNPIRDHVNFGVPKDISHFVLASIGGGILEIHYRIGG